GRAGGGGGGRGRGGRGGGAAFMGHLPACSHDGSASPPPSPPGSPGSSPPSTAAVPMPSRVARFGRIDRSVGEPPCARRCRRTEARNDVVEMRAGRDGC